MRSKWKIGYRIGDGKNRRGELITKDDINRVVKISDGYKLRAVRILPSHLDMKYGALVLTKKIPRYKKKSI